MNALEHARQPAAPQWYCLRTRAKSEHIAARSLRRLTIETCCPRIRQRTITRRGPVWFVEALFPGYLFARFDYASAHRHVESATGVRSVVRFGAVPAVVGDDVIDALRLAAPEEAARQMPPPLRPGDAAWVMEGPLAGLSVVVKEVLPARERVRVLLEFLGRRTVTDVPTGCLSPANETGVPPALRRDTAGATR